MVFKYVNMLSSGKKTKKIMGLNGLLQIFNHKLSIFAVWLAFQGTNIFSNLNPKTKKLVKRDHTSTYVDLTMTTTWIEWIHPASSKWPFDSPNGGHWSPEKVTDGSKRGHFEEPGWWWFIICYKFLEPQNNRQPPLWSISKKNFYYDWFLDLKRWNLA